MRVLMVASEAFPLVKTGGLADVVGALPAALAQHGVITRVLLPAYRGTRERADVDEDGALDLGDRLSVGPARLLPFTVPEAALSGWLVDCPALYERDGGPYLNAAGHDWPDNHLRFGLLSNVAAHLAITPSLTDFAVDLVHAHDWQAGLTPAYFAAWGTPHPPTVFTGHNLHFAGRFSPDVLPALQLPASMHSIEGVEFYGAMSFLKAGLYYADRITTVSPTYAAEIQTEMGGEGLHGLLSTRQAVLAGVLNGIDDRAWDPANDAALVAPYSAASLSAGKAACKNELQRALGLAVDAEAPLVGMVGRLTSQKGVDLLLEVLPQLLAAGAQLAVLGSGDGPLELALSHAAASHSGRVAFVLGYDEALSHRLIAGADLLAVPSRFEPCGLTQMYAQRYGTAPIVRSTGGLADTVIDADADPGTGNGFVFGPPTAQAFAEALQRALLCYRDTRRMSALQQRAMKLQRGWFGAAVPYVDLYAGLLGVGSRAI